MYAPELLTWTEHAQKAASQGCILASIRNSGEQLAVEELLEDQGFPDTNGGDFETYAWLGGVATDPRTIDDNSGWAWIDGSEYSYNSFDRAGSNQPTPSCCCANCDDDRNGGTPDNNVGIQNKIGIHYGDAITVTAMGDMELNFGEWVNAGEFAPAPTGEFPNSSNSVQNLRSAIYRCCADNSNDSQDWAQCDAIIPEHGD